MQAGKYDGHDAPTFGVSAHQKFGGATTIARASRIKAVDGSCCGNRVCLPMPVLWLLSFLDISLDALAAGSADQTIRAWCWRWSCEGPIAST